jgi:hypothetical protein
MVLSQPDTDTSYPSCRQMAKSLFYPRRVTWFAFTLLSILGINFFVDAADNEFNNNNPFTGLVAIIGAPLYHTLSSFIYSVFPGWSWTFANPYFGWVMIPLVFGYLYLVALVITHLWRYLTK